MAITKSASVARPSAKAAKPTAKKLSPKKVRETKTITITDMRRSPSVTITVNGLSTMLPVGKPAPLSTPEVLSALDRAGIAYTKD